jgi:hypothetical protein
MSASPDAADSGTKASQKQSPSDNKNGNSKTNDKAYRALWDLESAELKTWVYSVSSIFKGA